VIKNISKIAKSDAGLASLLRRAQQGQINTTDFGQKRCFWAVLELQDCSEMAGMVFGTCTLIKCEKMFSILDKFLEV
jgi:hypothetical protein